MALDAFALTSLDNVKSYLNIPTLTITQDATLERMINASSAKIETFLDRKILKREFTEYQDGRSSDRILLREWPADKPTELWIDNDSVFTDTNNQIATSDYVLEDEIGVQLINGRGFGKGRRNIKVVYEAGYTTVPYDIEEACIMTVAFFYDLRSDRRIGVSQKGKNSENTTFLDDLPSIVKGMLDPYRRVDFGFASVAVQNG